MKSYLHEMHLFDLNTSLYGNDFILDLIIKGLRTEFKSADYNFFHRLNSKTGNVGIYVGANFDLTHIKHNFLNGFKK